MNLVDLFASGASAATMAGATIAYGQMRASKRHKTRDLQRQLDQAKQTEQIQKAIGDFKTSVDERFDKNDGISADATRRIDRLEQEQFGPNHGGARQAINELTADVRNLSSSLSSMSERVVRVETLLSSTPLTATKA